MNLWFEENFLSSFDYEVQGFYNRAISKEIDFKNSTKVSRIKLALKEIVNAYAKGTVDTLASRILFDTPAKRCAYVLKHSPCFTSAVAKHFYKLLSNNPILFQSSLERGTIGICCLGGGPATDVVAVVKVLGALKYVRIRRGCQLHVKISVIDISEDWEKTAHNILETLEGYAKFFDQEKIKLSFQFLKADLTKEWTDDVSKEISNADMVTMIYFVSAVNGSPVSEKCPYMIQRIMEKLRPEAVLFFLDSSKDLHYRRVKIQANKQAFLHEVYGPNIQDFHHLSMQSIRRFLELYSSSFKMFVCLTNCFTTTAAWVKGPFPLLDAQKENLWCLDISNNAWRKIEAYNNLKREVFRQKVEKLLMRYFGFTFLLEETEYNESEKLEKDWNLSEKLFYPAKSKRKRFFYDT